MSSFSLLDDADLLLTNHKPKKGSSKKNKKQSISSTEFTKIHLEEVWVIILSYCDIRTLYLQYVHIDRKVYQILQSIPFQKSLLIREFHSILSGEEEKDHEGLYERAKPMLTKRIEQVLERNDPLNTFGLRSTFSKKSDHPLKVFVNIYFGLLNRRINLKNRNMKIRDWFRSNNYYFMAFSA